MNLAQTFYISVYALACLSGGILAWAEGNPYLIPTGLTVPIAIMAFFMNEQWRVLRLSSAWANALALLAFIYPVTEFFSDNPEGRLLAGAHLMVFLQWIVLLQEKEPAQYWWVFALSILQVAVSAVLTQSGVFGLLLMGYLLLAMWSLAVFSLFQGERQFAEAERFAEQNPNAFDAPLMELPIALAEGGDTFPASEAGVYKLSSMVRGSLQHEHGGSWINARFVAGVFGMTGMAMGIGLLFFLLIPRFWLGNNLTFRSELMSAGLKRPLSGFSERVQLGDLGQILESTEVVLHVKLLDKDKKPVDLRAYSAEIGLEEPLFSGTVLVDYDRGRWTPSAQKSSHAIMEDDSAPNASLHQEYELEPIGTKVLFAIRPFFTHGAGRIEGESSVKMQLNSDSGVLIQEGTVFDTTLKYTVFSPRHPLQGASVSSLSPAPLEERNHSSRGAYLAIPKTVTRLADLALSLTTEDELPVPVGQSREQQKARVLETYLRDSGKFTYSLDAKIQDASVDPIEDFLFNRKTGHCEYYASALALMLRSVGIPSRLVTGFKGGVATKYGNYEVQQRHAHAWVEAFVDGRWRVMDATPAAQRQFVVDAALQKTSWWQSFQLGLSALWSKYVLQMSFARQQEELYEPLKRAAEQGLLAFRGGSGWKVFWRMLRDFITSPAQWFSWSGGLVAFCLMVFLSALWIGVTRLIRYLIELRVKRAGGLDRRGVQVEFYEAFLKLMAEQGLSRGETQTQREFAAEVQAVLAGRLREIGLATLPTEISEAFYRVRFGWQSLTQAEHGALLEKLGRFATGLEGKPGATN